MGGKSKDPGKAAAKVQREQLRRLAAIDLPELQELVLQDPELIGLLEAEQLDRSALEDISLDPRMREAQLKALADLEESGRTGLTAEDRATMAELTRQTDASEQARQKGILQGMAERGQLDSGSQLIAQLQSNAAASTDARRQAEQLAAQSSSARRQALQQAGGLAGQMESAEYGRQAQAGSARDAINRFNAQQRMGVQQQNLAARQAMENQRAAQRNQENMYNIQRSQQQFQNELAKAGAQGGVTNNLAQIAANQPQQPGMFQSALGGAATGAGIGASMGPAGAGYGAAIGAGAGVLGSMFEDGGVVHAQNGAVIPDFSKMSLQEGLQKGNGVILGQDTDKTAADVQTYEDAKALTGEANGGMGDLDYASALKGLNQLLGAKKQKAPSYKFQNTAPTEAKNIMQAAQIRPMTNPFAAADGGVPAYRCGGVHNEEYMDGGNHYASDGKGDIVDVPNMDNYSGDRVDAKINEGEMILNVPQQQRLMDMIRGEISPQELGDGDIIEGVPAEYRNQLHQEKSQGSEKEDKIAGLEKLLEALGRNK